LSGSQKPWESRCKEATDCRLSFSRFIGRHYGQSSLSEPPSTRKGSVDCLSTLLFTLYELNSLVSSAIESSI
jgi:hypothetical protein